MLVKEVKYEDFNGNERSDTLYFNLTRTELLEWQADEDESTGGLAGRLQRIQEKPSLSEVFKIFREIIRRSYGIKTADGSQFLKSDDIFIQFAQSPAYDALFTEMTSDPKAATNFINGLIPKSLQQDMKKSRVKAENA